MEEYKRKQLPNGSVYLSEQEIKEVLEANKIYNRVYHPDTKEKVLAPFRMSWFVPVNLPIVFGMLCVPQTLLNVVFFQWINQTYNAAWNYSNRNATCSFSNKELAMSYGAAASSSIGVALIGRELAKRFGTSAGRISKQRFVNGAVAMCALSCAGFLNLYLIRYNEMRKGIQVSYKGKDFGLSKKAAKIAVVKSASTRAVLPIPMMIIVPGLWRLLEAMKLAPKGKLGIIAADMIIVALQLTISLPLALSLFTQEVDVPKEKLEPEFHNLKDAEGKPISTFTINKGL
jgi:tricarboxylate carrier